MAEFCSKCANELRVKESLTLKELDITPNTFTRVLCEGCGWIYIENLDGEEVVYRTTKEED